MDIDGNDCKILMDEVYIDLPERFVGIFEKNRISVSETGNGKYFIDITDETGLCINESTHENLNNINGAIMIALNHLNDDGQRNN